jgi:ABC-2 type transport system ATP-binding protein
VPAVIEVEGLRKRYRRLRGGVVTAVDGLDLSVPEGGVFGFLGPNGSGKTTTIRCLLGLVRPTEGRCRVLGAEVPGALPAVMTRVGSIVETPALFPGFSGRRNLELLAGIDGLGRRAVEASLERVGLAERAKDLVKTYSLGMKQRLALAAALMKDPALLVLDEPANGLDPAGIKEIRELLRSLGAEGRTVFVSSHLLGEIEQTCDRVAILTRGRCVAAGAVDEVLHATRTNELLVRVDDLDGAVATLSAAGFTCRTQDGALVVEAAATRGADVSRVLGGAALWVSELRPVSVSLEDVFLELTQGAPT